MDHELGFFDILSKNWNKISPTELKESDEEFELSNLSPDTYNRIYFYKRKDFRDGRQSSKRSSKRKSKRRQSSKRKSKRHS